MIIPVKKVTIVTLMDKQSQILEEVGKIGVVQLNKLSSDEILGFREETAEDDVLHDQLYDRWQTLHDKLSDEGEQIEKESVDIKPEKLEEVITNYETRYAEQDEQYRELDNHLTTLKNARPILDCMKKLDIHPRDIGEFTHLFTKAGIIKPESLTNLEHQFKMYKKIVYKSTAISEQENFLYINGLIDLKDQVEKKLMTFGFKEFKPPENIPDKVDDAITWIEDEQKTLQDKLQVIARNRDEVRKEVLSKYTSISSSIRRLRSLTKAQKNMLRSETMTILQGWVPVDRIDRLNKFLNTVKREEDGGIVYSYDDPAPNEDIPTIMKNPKLFRAYELLTRQYGHPDPRESDPTPISTILWVIMFGIMFPDAGQGIFVFLLGFTLAYKLKKPVVGINMSKIGRLMMGLGLSAMIFGFLLGSFFLIEIQPLWPGLSKAWVGNPNNVMWIIKIAIFFGMAQIFLGMTISIKNHLKAGEKLEALLGEHGVAGLLTFMGVFIVALLFLGVRVVPGVRLPAYGINVLTHWTIAIPIIGLVAIFIKPIYSGEGASMGLGVVLETAIASLSNMFSYARIAGFAIAHAAFGLVAAELLHVNPALGIGLGLIFLNFFSLTLELLVVMIQALRLLYYEFSTKFFKGTGVPYIPFRL